MPNSIGFDLVFPQAQLKSALVVSLLSVWVLVGVFYYLNRFTHRRYFAIWNVAWLFYALWLTLNFQFPWDTVNPWINMVKHWCIGIAAAFLLWGSGDLLGQRNRERVLGLFLGFLLVWSYVGAQHFESPWVIQVPIFALIGISSIATGVCFGRFRRASGFLGAGLLSGGFLLWGGYLTTYPWWQTSEYLVCASFFVAAVLQLFIAVSMIVLVLEEARRNLRRAVRHWHEEHQATHQLHYQVLRTEEKYRQLFEQAHVGIVLVHRDSRQILDCNPEAHRLLAPDGPLSPGQDFLTYFAPEARVDDRNGMGWLDRMLERQRWALRRTDQGQPVLVEISGAPLPDDDGVVFQLFLQDCSDRARLEQQLRRAEKLSALGQMISGVAHELNNPLAVIQGYLELILKRHTLLPQPRADLDKVVKEGHRAAKLVDQFLTFAHEQPIRRQTADLNALVRQVAELRRFDFERSQISVSLELDPELLPALVDPEQIQQVLANLIQNSLQAMANQSQPARLRLTTCRGSQGNRVIIEDSGPGIPESLVARIFDPFFTTKKVGQGTGLGLAITHSIIVAHEGRITYQPSALGGAGFVLDLPMSAVEAPPVDTLPSHSGSELEPQPAVAAASILVLDDEPDVAAMLAEMLKYLGHCPTVCHDPEEGLEAIKKQPFDLILSDFRMPTMNGEQFYRKVTRADAEMAQRIIFLTGDVLCEETRAFLESIEAPVIKKPFQLAAVENAVARQLVQSRRPSVLDLGRESRPANAPLAISVELPSRWNPFPSKKKGDNCLQHIAA